MIWRVRIGECEYDAPDTDTLIEWVREGRVLLEHYIYHPILEKWMYARDVEEIRPYLTSSLVGQTVPPALPAKNQLSPKKLHQKYRLIHARVWPTLIVFWLLSMGGAGIFARMDKAEYESAWVILVMLVLVGCCMATERGWNVWLRTGYFIGAWIGQTVLTVPLVFTLGILLAASGRTHLVDRACLFFAGIPFVIYGMWRSEFFTKQA